MCSGQSAQAAGSELVRAGEAVHGGRSHGDQISCCGLLCPLELQTNLWQSFHNHGEGGAPPGQSLWNQHKSSQRQHCFSTEHQTLYLKLNVDNNIISKAYFQRHEWVVRSFLQADGRREKRVDTTMAGVS